MTDSGVVELTGGKLTPSRYRSTVWSNVLRSGAAVTVLALLTGAVFYRQLFSHWTFPWDFLATYTEAPPFVAASVATGHLFSWSPFVAGGSPTTINVQAGLYYPVWWLAGLAHLTLELSELTDVQVVHVFLGGVGAMILCRVRGLGLRWALIAGAAFVLFGGFYGEAEHADAFRGFAYLPWLLWSLTIPSARRWWRLLWLPLLGWLVITGAYPGQLGSFAILSLVYLVSQLATLPKRQRLSTIRAIVWPALATAAIAVAVLLPYLLASHNHELVRPVVPTAAIRAQGGFELRDVLGLYLNPFAWHRDATVFSWTVGVPVLVGLFCTRSITTRRQAPLIAVGIVATLLAFGARLMPVAHLMADLPTLFPSRFPAVEYKAGIALVLIVVAADAWGELATRQVKVAPWFPVLAGLFLLLGVLVGAHPDANLTRTPWLVVGVIALSVGLAVFRPPTRALFMVLLALVVVDGWRAAHDNLLDGTASSWGISPAVGDAVAAPESYVYDLKGTLERSVRSRPARTSPVTRGVGGSNADSFGWVADGYRLADYGGTVERVRAQAQETPVWEQLMLQPWHAYTFPCTAVGCRSGQVRLPNPASWRPSPAVTTTSYSIRGIVYHVHVRTATLMAENELAIEGWSTSSPYVQPVIVPGIPVRTWRLSPGTYTFKAAFHQPRAWVQVLAAVAAVVLWILAVVSILRQGLGDARSASMDPRMATTTPA